MLTSTLSSCSGTGALKAMKLVDVNVQNWRPVDPFQLNLTNMSKVGVK